jgi:hypothetical protein
VQSCCSIGRGNRRIRSRCRPTSVGGYRRELREALLDLLRFIVTLELSKHRV